MSQLTFMAAMASLMLSAASVFAAPRVVGVVQVEGSAPADVRARASQTLAGAIVGIEGIEMISFAKLASVLGQVAGDALAACKDDLCIINATSKIKTEQIVVPRLDNENGQLVLRLRLLRTSTTAPGPLARISSQLAPGDERALTRALTNAALEIFPKLAAKSFGTLVVTGARPGAVISVAGLEVQVPLVATQLETRPTVKLRPGPHEVKVAASGHHPFTDKVEILVGQTTELQVSLSKNRSWGPLIVTGLSLAAAGVALAVGLSIRGLANDWEGACRTQVDCPAGFTREQYLMDQSTIDRGRFVTNTLFGVAGAAAVGAILWFFLDPGSDPVLGQ